MALKRWEPLGDIDGMRRYMDRVVDTMFGGMSRGVGLPTLEGGRAFSPNVEVYATDHDVVIKAELPGIDPNDVDVEITEDSVHLSGELNKESEIKEDNYYRSERQYGRFERVIPLPERVKDQEAKATFKNGVLTVRAPMAEPQQRPQSRKLQIQSND